MMSAKPTIRWAVVCLLSLQAFACLGQTPSALEVADAVNTFRAARERKIIEDFIAFLALPNVASSLPDMQANARHITALLEPRGFTVRTLRSGGAPYVFAELSTPGARETVLIYAHFDGQPVQTENWTYAPFTPTLLDGLIQEGGEPIELNSVADQFNPEWRIYARSAGDDKMPVIALIHMLDALRANGLELTVNLKLLLDGEEERGSPTLGQVIDDNPGLFDADLLLFCDGPMHQSRQTQLVFGVRGGRTLDITTYGANRPLHSGHYGNWGPNPIMSMAYLLTSMRDETGRILIEGYYDNVAALTESERAAIDAMPNIETQLKDELAVHTPEGSGTRIEELVTLPAFNARGITGGGVGDQGRNIILSSSTVSLNLRLVPNQRPERIRQIIENHITKEGYSIIYEDPTDDILRANPKVVKLDWRGGGSPGLRTSMDGPMAQRLINVMRELTPELILTPTMGGGLPLNAFASRIETPIIVLPLANHDNNQHGENENLRLQNLWDAIMVYGVVLTQLGRD